MCFYLNKVCLTRFRDKEPQINVRPHGHTLINLLVCNSRPTRINIYRSTNLFFNLGYRESSLTGSRQTSSTMSSAGLSVTFPSQGVGSRPPGGAATYQREKSAAENKLKDILISKREGLKVPGNQFSTAPRS